MSNPVFKQDHQGEILLFPCRLDEKISSSHLVRVINHIVNGMDLTDLLSGYKGGGTSSYHPRMLLKVLLYGYCMKIYTGRKIANALLSDITFMWLSGNQTPNFRTINNFRSGRLKESIESIFKSLLSFMFAEGYIRLEEYYCDGTTLLANANKHKVVWKRNQVRYRELVEGRIDETLKEIDALNKEEDLYYGNQDLGLHGTVDESRKERLDQAVSTLNHIIGRGKKNSSGKARALSGRLQKDMIRSKAYKQKENRCGQRSGYSKTDPDATPMRTKECMDDLRPAYNGLIDSENQYITGVSLHQNPNDGTCFKSHLKKALALLPGAGKVKHIIADAGFGTEENYEYLEKNEKITGLLKYPSYDKEQQKNRKKNPFDKDNMLYDVLRDAYLCPNGKWLCYKGDIKEINKNGFISISRLYTCENCQGCSFFDRCGAKREAGSNRQIKVNRNLQRHKDQVTWALSYRKRKKHDAQKTMGCGELFWRHKSKRDF